MKAVNGLFLVCLMLLNFVSNSAFAEHLNSDPIDQLLANSAKTVTFSAPTFQDIRFLACTGQENYNGECNTKSTERANAICVKLGYVRSVVAKVDYGYFRHEFETLWAIDTAGTMSSATYYEYFGPKSAKLQTFGAYFGYIDSLTCEIR